MRENNSPEKWPSQPAVCGLIREKNQEKLRIRGNSVVVSQYFTEELNINMGRASKHKFTGLAQEQRHSLINDRPMFHAISVSRSCSLPKLVPRPSAQQSLDFLGSMNVEHELEFIGGRNVLKDWAEHSYCVPARNGEESRIICQ